jgi:hypothetical protein
MTLLVRRLAPAVLAALVYLAAGHPSASAQVVAQTQATVRPVAAPGTADPVVNRTQIVNTVAPPAAGYGGYGYPYNQTPVNGYLNGVAAVTQANADYQVTIQQAKLGQEQAKQAQLDTRRQTLDQARYEQSLMPDPEQIRLKNIQEEIDRSRNNPPPTEIWSGKSLNYLLIDIQRAELTGLRGPVVPLDQQQLRLINVTDGTTRGSVGALKDGGKLLWPLPLKSTTFEKSRTKLDELAVLAFNQGSSGGVADDTITQMKATVKQLENQVKDAVADLSPDEYIKSVRFVREMKETVQTLQDPNVANYFSKKWTAQGNTVGELVRYMTANGLKFAPAVSGQQTAYTVLHRNLNSYDFGLAQLARR